MSANNHDNDDPNNVRYAKSDKLTENEIQKGILIHIYANTVNKPFAEWLKWMEQQGYNISKKSQQ